MRIADLLLLDFDVEIENTRRTLQRIPDTGADWRPHEKSMPMGRLAMHCATLPLFGFYILEDAGMDMANSTRPHASLVFTTAEHCVRQLEEHSAVCRAALLSADDEALMQTWPFTFGEMVITRESRARSFRQMFFDHLIHHTAQLGVYLRLNDIAVPGLYGPSADEQWVAPS